MKQHRPNRKRHRLNPEDIRQLCHEVFPVGDGALPEKAIGWTDLRGRWKRLEVEYPNGWTLSFRFDDSGVVQDVTTRLKFTVRKPANTA